MKRLLPLLIGFVLGAAVMYGVLAVLMSQKPATPHLQPPTAIQVTLYPGDGIVPIDAVPVDIPPDKLDFVFRLLTPAEYFPGGVHEFITPVMADAVITHADGKQTRVLVRDHGVNPAVVTVDGRNYFYARNDPDVFAGANQLFRLVNEPAHAKRAVQPSP